uniref:Telomeric repeat binding factor 2 n=1 Tax=Poecilia reticulata TaxID=8081 RepID=A0A3P9P8R2_POERE
HKRQKKFANMAANESVNIGQVKVQKVVNRWLVEYYFSLTVEFFKNQQYADFCAIRDVLDAVLQRPIESVDDMTLKIRLLQFLSRINEGEKLDSFFEPDESKTPLESALNLLESMKANFQIPQADFDYVSTLIKEMVGDLFIAKADSTQVCVGKPLFHFFFKPSDPSSGEPVCPSDSSSDTSADASSPDPVPQKSSTPHKDGQSKIPSKSLWLVERR